MDSDTAWKKWGEQDPYFGVISHPRFRRDNFAEHRARFFESGETRAMSLLATAEQLYGSFRRRTAVDFGCGVGRIIIPLSRHFDKVVGIDVAPAMIAEAKANCAEFGVSNATFINAPSELAASANDVDFVYSLIVLQHIPVRRGLSLMRELLDRLSPNGVAALHVTVGRLSRWPREFVYLTKHYVPGARFAFNLIQGRRITDPIMQTNKYPLAEVLQLYQAMGMDGIFLEPVIHAALGFILFGRKRAP
jgi:2-polyprenyl-3-methyl-5-hydroxy-6-metoxy-1,4-benzoquinol methylase